MRKGFMLLSLVAALAISAGPALAENIKGRVGITGLLGFNIPADNDFGPDKSKLESDAGFIGGGGFIYGIDKNFAAEMIITHTNFNAETPTRSVKGDFDVINIALGGQYRFAVDVPHLVPYVGAGLDIVLSDFDPNNHVHHDVNTTVGVHASGGIDYFLTRSLAVTAEARAVIAPETDITGPGTRGNFDPSSFSGLVGARFFFN
jgi:outer membrane protein